ncbi:MAG: (Fe-S)-binding protein [Desulfatibacillaceae bacterium]
MKTNMEHSDILHRCFRCGYCKLPADFTDINCPSYLKYRFETYSPGGRMWLLRGWLNGELTTSDRLLEIMYSCATCGNCVAHCAMPKFRDEILEAFGAAKELLVEAGTVPPAVRDFLSRLQRAGNAYGVAPKKRADWTGGLEVPEYDGHEYLLFVGDVASYDDRGRDTARAVAGLLKQWNVSFGILGAAEKSDGNDALACGERDLFEDLARHNIEEFTKRGVRRVICVSPHGFNALRNHYPALGSPAQAFHYTQVLALLSGSAKWRTDAPEITVTYHDPCYLGRHNHEYDAARMALKNAPGVKLVEMVRKRQNALCCGGGGGNVFTDMVSGGAENSARVRVREALDTGADVLAVSCPACAVMFEDAVKTEGAEDALRVLDVAAVLAERVA